MTCRVPFTLVSALAVVVACDATLGGGGGAEDAATALDGRPVDSSVPADAALDARVCAGGGTLAPDGSCLQFVATPVTYAGGKVACAQLAPGGHLAYIKSQQLHDTALTLIGTTDTWIGGNDQVTEATFVWDDGTAFAFTNWSTGEPNSGGSGATYQEDCVIIAGARVERKWDDRPCDASEVPASGTFAYLCQY